MATTRKIKCTIGGPESVAGTAESRTHVIPHRGLPSIKPAFTKQPDPAIVGNNIITGKFVLRGDIGGGIPLAFRPVPGIGMLINSLLGQESTPTQIAAAIKIRYTGSEASCKITADTSADTLTSETGDKGSETGDGDFGSSGDIDLTAGATDTVGELVTEIDGYTDYECVKLYGEDAVDAADIIDITSGKQGKNTWAVVTFSSASSGIYLHQWEVDLSTTERPVYSIQIDERGDNHLYDGCVVDQLSLSAALGAFVEAEATILGFEETGSQSTSSLTLEDVDPMKFSAGDFSIGETDFTYVRNHSLDIQNGHNADGYGKGSIYRLYHEKGIFAATGSVQLRLDSDSFGLRTKINSGDTVAIFFDFEGKELADDINEHVYVELPYSSLDDFEWNENGDVLDATIPFAAVKPKASPYNSPLTLSMLTDDSAAF